MKAVTAIFLLLAVQFSMSVQAAPPPSVIASAASASAQAAEAGIKTCLPAIEKLENWLSREQSGNAVVFWDRAAPDKNLFSALLALENRTNSSLANLNVVPSSDGQCVVEYTQTGYVAQSCAEHFKSLGNAARFVRDLNSKTALIQGQGVQIFLSPAGQGCLWVRKEIIKQPVTHAQRSQADQVPKSADKTPSSKSR